jgi:hypothetical protein
MNLYDFWNTLCVELEYRFFSGIPTEDFKLMHESMSPEFLHFVPTLDESLALGLVSGAKLSGLNGAVMMGARAFDLITPQFKGFNIFFNIPALFIVDNDYNPLELHQRILEDDPTVINKLVNYINNTNESAILVINKGTLL